MARYMEALPDDRYHQDYFCRSACCVAGHAILRFGTPEQRRLFRADVEKFDQDPELSDIDGHINVSLVAGDLLGGEPMDLLDGAPAGLFDGPDEWPDKYVTDGYVTREGATRRLRDIAARLG